MCSRPSRFGLVRREGERLFVRRLSQQSRCTMSGTIVLSVSVRPDHGGSRWPTDDVRFGSKADISAMLIHVRFTPKSGHWLNASGCPLCARNGLMRCSNSEPYPEPALVNVSFSQKRVDNRWVFCSRDCDLCTQ